MSYRTDLGHAEGAKATRVVGHTAKLASIGPEPTAVAKLQSHGEVGAVVACGAAAEASVARNSPVCGLMSIESPRAFYFCARGLQPEEASVLEQKP